MTLELLVISILNIGLLLANLAVLGLGVKLYTDQSRQTILKGIGK